MDVIAHGGAGADARTAAGEAIAAFEAATGATAGVIAIDREERVGRAHDADAMGTDAGN
jgi:isoaspartyl peptidase/L-asparaginase-like protein (Ntn-hydrolase superfamily)